MPDAPGDAADTNWGTKKNAGLIRVNSFEMNGFMIPHWNSSQRRAA